MKNIDGIFPSFVILDTCYHYLFFVDTWVLLFGFLWVILIFRYFFIASSYIHVVYVSHCPPSIFVDGPVCVLYVYYPYRYICVYYLALRRWAVAVMCSTCMAPRRWAVAVHDVVYVSVYLYRCICVYYLAPRRWAVAVHDVVYVSHCPIDYPLWIYLCVLSGATQMSCSCVCRFALAVFCGCLFS